MIITILGAGLSGISLAYFLQNNPKIKQINLIEKNDKIGGLCRSLVKDGYTWDIGPHILFSKDKEMLDLMLSVIKHKNDLRRSNQIIYKGRWVQYPFENDLSKLPGDDLEYCLGSFLNNPYRDYSPDNMLQFFLKTFGEGITNTYLRPYNEKIWKFDPAFMDTQMVERIPQPTNEEIKRSANGETVDGYIHQLYFHFPTDNGIEAVVDGFADRLSSKCVIHLNSEVTNVYKQGEERFIIKTHNGEEYVSNMVVSTIPIQELTRAYNGVSENIKLRVNDLHYNSIIIAFIKTSEDLSGDNFAFMNPEKDIIFHRISKMDFLGDSYQSDSATYMVEVTYREGDYTDSLSDEILREKIADGIVRIGFAKNKRDVEFIDISRHQYAYVIYDLHHLENMTAIREYYSTQGVLLNGRFGNFEYWNMDKVLREAKNMAEEINERLS